jgi:ribosome-associated translation inhibitor RaiA
VWWGFLLAEDLVTTFREENEMFVDVRAAESELSHRARQLVDQSIKQALGDYRAWIPRVRVRVENAAKQYRCVAAVSVFGRGLVQSDCTEGDLLKAIDQALESIRVEVENSVREAQQKNPVFESWKKVAN